MGTLVPGVYAAGDMCKRAWKNNITPAAAAAIDEDQAGISAVLESDEAH